jgi:hypothetical protein
MMEISPLSILLVWWFSRQRTLERARLKKPINSDRELSMGLGGRTLDVGDPWTTFVDRAANRNSNSAVNCRSEEEEIAAFDEA